MKASSSSCGASISPATRRRATRSSAAQILIDEGDVYNSTLWDASILRLNQLGYFEALKENESYELKRNPGTNTVDINLKVKERGKNSISLNGGVSGISGTFVGAQLFHQQFPRAGRDADAAGAGGNAAGPRHAGLHGAVSFQPAAAGGNHGLPEPVQLQPGAPGVAADRPESDSRFTTRWAAPTF